MLRKRPLVVEVITAAALIAAPFVLPYLGFTPTTMNRILVWGLFGVGSFPGAIIGGLIAGEIISITSMFNPGYAYVMLFVAMTLVLVLRPYGLLGTAGRE